MGRFCSIIMIRLLDELGSHHALRDAPGLVHVVMTRPLAIDASERRILFEKLPWSFKPRASLWAHHGGA